jgi:8-oxo-dGTP pyrophosphatase MutT (NUDIX family)
MADTATERLQHALLQTGMMNQLFIDGITLGAYDEAYVEEALANFKAALHPEPHKVFHRYVLGFVFNRNLGRVLLVLKNRPAWQANKLNGIGGKIEVGETPLQAMEREFREETGFVQRLRQKEDEVDTIQWHYVGRRHRVAQFDYQDEAYEMFIYAAWWDDVQQLVQNDSASRGTDTRYRGHIYTWEPNSLADEPIVAPVLDRNHLHRMGVPGLVWTMEAALCSLQEGFTFDVEDPMKLEHLL